MIVVHSTSPSRSRSNSRHTANRHAGSSRHSTSGHRTIIHQRLNSLLSMSGGSMQLNKLIRDASMMAVALITERRDARRAGRRDYTRGLMMKMMIDGIGMIISITKIARATSARLALARAAAATRFRTSDANWAAAATTAAARAAVTADTGALQSTGRDFKARRPCRRSLGTTKILAFSSAGVLGLFASEAPPNRHPLWAGVHSRRISATEVRSRRGTGQTGLSPIHSFSVVSVRGNASDGSSCFDFASQGQASVLAWS